MKTLKYYTGASLALFALTVSNAGWAYADDVNKNMDDLEITMEVVDESIESTEDVVNKIELPVLTRDRVMKLEQVRNRDENSKRPEDVVDKGREMKQEIQNHRKEGQKHN